MPQACKINPKEGQIDPLFSLNPCPLAVERCLCTSNIDSAAAGKGLGWRARGQWQGTGTESGAENG